MRASLWSDVARACEKCVRARPDLPTRTAAYRTASDNAATVACAIVRASSMARGMLDIASWSRARWCAHRSMKRCGGSMKHWQLKALVAALSLGAFAAGAQPATSTTTTGTMHATPPAVDASGRVIETPAAPAPGMNAPPRSCAGLTGQDMRDCVRAGGNVGSGNVGSDTGA